MYDDRETQAMIDKAGWWDGTIYQWYALPIERREDLAFEATGCLAAFPTWEGPVDCCHNSCKVRRGEMTPIEFVAGQIQNERDSNWLRFMTDEQYEKIRAVLLALAEEHKVYNLWKIPGAWQLIVYGSIMPEKIGG